MAKTDNLKKFKFNKKDQLKEIENRSLNDEIKRDKDFIKKTLERTKSIENSEKLKSEERTSNVLKKLIFLVGSGDMKIESDLKIIKASENILPISTYIAHGSRIIIQLPPSEEPNKIFDWLTKDTKLYNRYAATHAVTKKGDENQPFREIKTSVLGELFFNVIPKFLGFKKETKHWGIDLAIGGYGEKNYKGNLIEANGSHGHMYIHYEAPTLTHPGAIMIGIEATSPKDPDHSKFGKADSFSVTGGAKWENMKNQKWEGDEKPLIPNKYNGMHINLDNDKIDDLLNLDITKYESNIATIIPNSSLYNLNKSLEKTDINKDHNQNISDNIKLEAQELGKSITDKADLSDGVSQAKTTEFYKKKIEVKTY